jgi:hypothetical protein
MLGGPLSGKHVNVIDALSDAGSCRVLVTAEWASRTGRIYVAEGKYKVDNPDPPHLLF